MVSEVTVKCVAKLEVLSVTLDSYLSFDEHIADVVHACNDRTRTLRHIRPLNDQGKANTDACSIVCTRLDYCNYIFYEVSDSNIYRHQHQRETPVDSVAELLQDYLQVCSPVKYCLAAAGSMNNSRSRQ